MTRDSRLTAVLRCLRIALSAVFGSLCLLITIFWVRSYSYADSGLVKILPWEYVQVDAGEGRMCVWFEHKPINVWGRWYSHPITVRTPPDAEDRIPCFDLAFWPTFARLYTAHWFLAVMAASLAVAPWYPRRFSLRALMITVTGVATIAGVIAWVDRTF